MTETQVKATHKKIRMNRYHRSYLEGFQHWCWHLCCNGLRNSWDDPFPRPACARDKRAELSWDKDLTVYISAPIWGRIIRWYLSLPFSYSRIGWIPDTVFLLHPALAPCETMFYWPMVPLQYQRIPIGYSKPGITITKPMTGLKHSNCCHHIRSGLDSQCFH